MPLISVCTVPHIKCGALKIKTTKMINKLNVFEV